MKSQYLVLLILLLTYGLLAAAHAYLAPLTTGPDELAHYEYMRFIVEHGRLPLDGDERAQASYKSDQPPLFHLVAALPAAWGEAAGPPDLKRVQDHPRRPLIQRTRHAWGLYNTEAERWPFRAEILRWQIGRGVAILFGLATISLTFLIARFIFADAWLALASAAIVGLIPRFMLTGSMLNYETMLACVTALFLWTLLQTARHLSPTAALLLPFTLGCLAGLAITIKLSSLILPLEIVVALWLIGRQAGWSWTQIARQIALAACGCLMTVSWWFGFILYQFNTIAADGWWVGTLRPLIAADGSDATTNLILSLFTDGEAGFTAPIENLDSGPFWAWVVIFFRTFWQVGIEGQYPLGAVGPLIALLICLVAAGGIFKALAQAASPRKLWLQLLLLHLLMPLILPLLRYLMTFSLSDTAQGRHVLFMAAPAMAILLVWGWLQLWLKATTVIDRTTDDKLGGPFQMGRTPKFAIATIVAFLLLWTLTQLWTMGWAYNPLLPVDNRPMQMSETVNQPFDPNITLLGYNHQLVQAGQLLQIELIWQATGISQFDYLTEVSLQAEAGQIVSQWLGYSANGRYPTRAWDEGDVIRDTIWLTLHAVPTGEYQITVNLRPMSLRHPQPLLDSPRLLTTLSVTQPPPSKAVQLWHQGQPLRRTDRFNYRETILVTWADTAASGGDMGMEIVGLEQSHQPLLELGQAALFIVGPDWPTGEYALVSGPDIVADRPTFQVVNRWPRQFAEPPMSERVEANFDNRVKLLGYDLLDNRAEPGGGIPLTLYWQGLDWLGQDLTIVAKPIAEADQTAYGGRDRLPQEGYRVLYWTPGEIVSDPFAVPIAAHAPDGIYQIFVGLYPQSAEGDLSSQPTALPLMQDGQPTEATSIKIGPIKVGQTPPEFLLEQATPQQGVNQTFGDESELVLLGYDLQPCEAVADGCALQLRLYWRVAGRLPLDYTTFVHVRNEADETVAQKDQQPKQGAYPTRLWEVGELIADDIAIPLPDTLPAESCQLVIGLYDWRSGVRLPVPAHPDNSFPLLTTPCTSLVGG